MKDYIITFRYAVLRITIRISHSDQNPTVCLVRYWKFTHVKNKTKEINILSEENKLFVCEGFWVYAGFG